LALASVSDEDGFEGEGGFMEKLVVPADWCRCCSCNWSSFHTIS
jgi:hypothetical protein